MTVSESIPEEQVQQLPQWARIAFAGRCARRVQPLFVPFYPNAPQEHIDLVESAITLVEKAAAAPANHNHFSGPAFDISVRGSKIIDTAYFATVRHAGYSAFYATQNVTDPTNIYAVLCSVSHAFDAAIATDYILHKTGPEKQQLQSLIDKCICRDFEKLVQLAKDNGWDDNTPVGPDVFGELWPEGEPDWEEISKKIKLIIAEKIEEEKKRGPLWWRYVKDFISVIFSP